MSRNLRVSRFVAVGAMGLTVQLGSVWIAVHLLRCGPVVATAAGVVLAVAHNFVWHWRWTWADRQVDAALAFVRFATANGAIALVGNVAVVWLLLRLVPLEPIAANLAAVGCCAAANYLASDRLVFPSQFSVGSGQSAVGRWHASAPEH